jgi:hypothetical protein
MEKAMSSTRPEVEDLGRLHHMASEFTKDSTRAIWIAL